MGSWPIVGLALAFNSPVPITRAVSKDCNPLNLLRLSMFYGQHGSLRLQVNWPEVDAIHPESYRCEDQDLGDSKLNTVVITIQFWNLDCLSWRLSH